jgi:hypothetical protein
MGNLQILLVEDFYHLWLMPSFEDSFAFKAS